MKQEKGEPRFFDQPKFWSPETCAEKLIEFTGIDDKIWELRTEVFNNLKAMNKFPQDEGGSEHQAKVDQVIGRLLEAI